MPYTQHIWHNDTAPAINEINLNEMEVGIASAHNTIDNDVVFKEEGKGLSHVDVTENLSRWLVELDNKYGETYTESGGIIPQSVVTTKINAVDVKVNNIQQAIDDAKSGTSTMFAKVATTGDYNDLKNTPTAQGNVVVSSDQPVGQSVGGVWFQEIVE